MNSSKGIIAALVALVVIGGGIGFYALSQNDDNNTQSQQTSESTENGSDTAMESGSNIVELASGNEELSTLVAAVGAAGLAETLSGEGPYTVFAPTNDAFSALPAGTLDTLLKPENKQQLTGILTYHVVSGKVMSTDLKDGQVVKTVQGGDLTVKIMDGKVMLEDATGAMAEVVTADVDASNGVVHVINKVLLPQ